MISILNGLIDNCQQKPVNQPRLGNNGKVSRGFAISIFKFIALVKKCKHTDTTEVVNKRLQKVIKQFLASYDQIKVIVIIQNHEWHRHVWS